MKSFFNSYAIFLLLPFGLIARLGYGEDPVTDLIMYTYYYSSSSSSSSSESPNELLRGARDETPPRYNELRNGLSPDDIKIEVMQKGFFSQKRTFLLAGNELLIDGTYLGFRDLGFYTDDSYSETPITGAGVLAELNRKVNLAKLLNAKLNLLLSKSGPMGSSTSLFYLELDFGDASNVIGPRHQIALARGIEIARLSLEKHRVGDKFAVNILVDGQVIRTFVESPRDASSIEEGFARMLKKAVNLPTEKIDLYSELSADSSVKFDADSPRVFAIKGSFPSEKFPCAGAYRNVNGNK